MLIDTTDSKSCTNNTVESTTTEQLVNQKTKIWLGGLPPKTNKNEFTKLFIEAFDLCSVSETIFSDISVTVKLGYGYVSIPTNCMEYIIPKIDNTNIEINGKKVELALAIPKAEAWKKIEDERDKKLYVGGLPIDITKQQLLDYFSQFGDLDYVNLIYGINSGLPRGFAFVKFKDEEDSLKVKNYENHIINGENVFIKDFNYFS